MSPSCDSRKLCWRNSTHHVADVSVVGLVISLQAATTGPSSPYGTLVAVFELANWLEGFAPSDMLDPSCLLAVVHPSQLTAAADPTDLLLRRNAAARVLAPTTNRFSQWQHDAKLSIHETAIERYARSSHAILSRRLSGRIVARNRNDLAVTLPFGFRKGS